MVGIGPCAVCGCEMMLPAELYLAAKHSDEIGFYCSYGHRLNLKRPSVKKDNVVQLKLVKGAIDGQDQP